tara:strand:+ start:70 stop:462 length:393 start_codon:yes stop_codon:yes gene_type:complete
VSTIINGWIQPFQKSKNGDMDKPDEFNTTLNLFGSSNGTFLGGVTGHLDLFNSGEYTDIGLSLNSRTLSMEILKEVKEKIENDFKDVEVVRYGCPELIPVEIEAANITQDYNKDKDTTYVNLSVTSIKLV